MNIFKSNAKTNESKLQVKLATLEYMMPRLTGMWTHLERQMCGVGTRGGPGEKQIEIDRRLIRKDIVKLKKDAKDPALENLIKKEGLELSNNFERKSVPKFLVAGREPKGRDLQTFSNMIKEALKNK